MAERTPSFFLSHGSPTAIVNVDSYSRALGEMGESLKGIKAIVVASAHGLAKPPELEITSGDQPPIVYDFYGFPPELYEAKYPCPGSPALAARVRELLVDEYLAASLSPTRGLDHGVWAPLKWMFPQADVPVVQVTIPYPSTPETVFRLGQKLAPLRDEKILLVGSGGAVHNLKRLSWRDERALPENWALEFQKWLIESLQRSDWPSILEFETRAPNATLAHPTPDHFYPIFFTLGTLAKDEAIKLRFKEFRFSNLSMLCFSGQ